MGDSGHSWLKNRDKSPIEEISAILEQAFCAAS
jgi:hypothetical protein